MVYVWALDSLNIYLDVPLKACHRIEVNVTYT